MPEHTQTIPLTDTDRDAALAICFSSFKELGWELMFAGEDKLVAATPSGWTKKGQHIIVTVADDTLSICSKMTGGELMDLSRVNRKNITDFLHAFELAKQSMLPGEKDSNLAAIDILRKDTARVMTEQQKTVAEIDVAMNLSGSNLYATYTIIAINIIVFVLMVIDGAGLVAPNGLVHLKWGSDYGPLTLSGDWWRLITCVFIHFGIIHLAMNMYTFYMAGMYLEPLLGKVKYVTAYLCTGVLSSITSLWWHTIPANSAGASGAIFGMYGLFLAFLTTNLIPELVGKGLLQSIGFFILYNLIYGMKGGVDNSAHVGGLISGLIIGYFYILGIKKVSLAKWVAPLTLILTVGFAYYYLNKHAVSGDIRKGILSELNATAYKDNDKFTLAYNRFVVLQDQAMEVFKDSSIFEDTRNKRLKEISLPCWIKAENLAEEMQTYDVSPQQHTKAGLVLQYIQLRKQEIVVFDELFAGKSGISKLNEVRSSIAAVAAQLK